MTRRIRIKDDSGASLIFALLFVTLVALVIAAVLSFADTNLRGTSALRDQATGVSAAEGAAQVAISTIRNDKTYLGGSNCFSGSSTKTLNDFYTTPNGQHYSATVTCSEDAPHALTGAINKSNQPPNAILTTATSGTGLSVKLNGSSMKMGVGGRVYSNSKIDVQLGILSASIGTFGEGSSCTGSYIPGAVCPYTPPAGDTTGDDPHYPIPTQNTNTPTVPNCTGKNKYYQMQPGTYSDATDLSRLNSLTDDNSCDGARIEFTPGVYYFTFNGTWRITHGWVVGGTTTFNMSAAPPTTSQLPGACLSPIPPNPIGSWTPPPANAGVQFVFGNSAQVSTTDSTNKGTAQIELCGPHSYTTVLPVVYGLTSSTGTVWTGNKNGDFNIYFQGMFYTPQATVDLNFKKENAYSFNYGVIAKFITIDGVGNANPPNPLMSIPDVTFGGGRTVLYLTVTVYPCTTAAACSAGGGKTRLQAKVGIIDMYFARNATIYSWSVQR
jgi:Tfp pilus assembly protein PilX